MAARRCPWCPRTGRSARSPLAVPASSCPVATVPKPYLSSTRTTPASRPCSAQRRSAAPACLRCRVSSVLSVVFPVVLSGGLTVFHAHHDSSIFSSRPGEPRDRPRPDRSLPAPEPLLFRFFISTAWSVSESKSTVTQNGVHALPRTFVFSFLS